MAYGALFLRQNAGKNHISIEKSQSYDIILQKSEKNMQPQWGYISFWADLKLFCEGGLSSSTSVVKFIFSTGKGWWLWCT